MADFRTPDKSTWCPGCGDFGVLAAIQKACANQGYESHDTVMVTGIGCSGKLNAYFKAYGFHGVHGRATALASGVKLANHKLHVLVAGGDGDGYGIGLNHLIHSLRRNIDMTYLVMDNHIYGLIVKY
jgi:2-oxoglutarate ferredoxin oxidoreductase subunit beta